MPKKFSEIREDNSAAGWIIGNVQGAIPAPIPKKFVKKASAGRKDAKQEVKEHAWAPQVHAYTPHTIKKTVKKIANIDDLNDWLNREKMPPNHPYHILAKKRFAKLHKEDVSGFADASAPSNSNYQTQLSPTQTAKKPKGKKMKKIKEYYSRRIVEAGKVCPECDNTGIVKKFGNNILCPSCSGDARVDNEKLMYRQAKDMLSTGKTTPVKEDVVNEAGKWGVYRIQQGHDRKDYSGHDSSPSGKVKRGGKHVIFKKEKDAKEWIAQNSKGEVMHTRKISEEVISSLEDIYPLLEAYKASPKLLSRTKHLVHPKLSKMLRDRLANRKPSSKGYKPSQGTLGLAAARRAQMSHSKETSPKGYSEEDKALQDVVDHPHKLHKKEPVKEDFGQGNFSTLTRDFPLKGKKKPNYSTIIQPKPASALASKPQMGSSNDNRMSEDVVLEKTSGELKKFAGDSKSGIKRRYLGAMRGRTATGKAAHPIEVDPILKTNTDLNKVVK